VLTALRPELLAELDDWRATQSKPTPSRPEAIRRLLKRALAKWVSQLGAASMWSDLSRDAGRFVKARKQRYRDGIGWRAHTHEMLSGMTSQVFGISEQDARSDCPRCRARDKAAEANRQWRAKRNAQEEQEKSTRELAGDRGPERSYTPRKVHILSEERVQEIIREGKSGWYRDGKGLAIQIPHHTYRSYWFFEYSVRGRTRRMSLGPTRLTTLAEARRIAGACWQLRQAGLDPRIERDRIRKLNCAAGFKPEWDSYRDFSRANTKLREIARP
jgi:hypothetical protein